MCRLPVPRPHELRATQEQRAGEATPRFQVSTARSLSPAIDSEFRASLESFHLINAQDSALAAPQTIKVMTAGNGDNSETMAARMSFLPHSLDQFLILNGLERNVPVVGGQRYKIVAQ